MNFLASLRAGLASVQPVVAGFVLFLLSGTLLFWPGHRVRQPITFDHAKHIKAGAGCTDCHSGAQDQSHATLPQVSTCLMCHESALTTSKEEAKIRTVAASGKELEWSQVTRVAPHVYFSHRRHVGVAKVDCAVCHGDMAMATSPPTRRFRPLNMNDCLACHEQHKVKSDCNDCHR